MNDRLALAQMQGAVQEPMVVIKPEVDDSSVVNPTSTEASTTTPTSYPSTSTAAPTPTVAPPTVSTKIEPKENVKKKSKNSAFKPKVKVRVHPLITSHNFGQFQTSSLGAIHKLRNTNLIIF